MPPATDSFEDAVLANTNAGGENCHRCGRGAAAAYYGSCCRFVDRRTLDALSARAISRILGWSQQPTNKTQTHPSSRGAALGALMGAALGEKAIPKRLLEGLAAYPEIKKEVDAFCDAALGAGQGVAAGAASGEL